jgi:hypothetical protein
MLMYAISIVGIFMRQEVNTYLSMFFIGVVALGAGFLIIRVSQAEYPSFVPEIQNVRVTE